MKADFHIFWTQNQFLHSEIGSLIVLESSIESQREQDKII